jgi:hypothetical protein
MRYQASCRQYARGCVGGYLEPPPLVPANFQFHLKAPRGFSEIRKIVAEELAKPIAYTGIFGFEHSQASCGAATASHAAAGPSARSREALVAPRGRGGDIDEKTKAGVKSDPKTAGATYGIPADLEA